MAPPLTINQRVHQLSHHDFSHEAIAAMLNITVAQVQSCLADPSAVIADPYTPAA